MTSIITDGTPTRSSTFHNSSRSTLLGADEAHVQRDLPMPAQFLESVDYEQHVDGGSRRPEAALLLRQYLLCLSEVAKAIGDDLEQYFAGVGDG